MNGPCGCSDELNAWLSYRIWGLRDAQDGIFVCLRCGGFATAPRSSAVAAVGPSLRGKMTGDLRLQELNQFRLHEGIVVGNVEADDTGVLKVALEALG